MVETLVQRGSGMTVEQIMSQRDFPLKMRLLAGRSGLSNEIRVRYVQKPGLALAGYTDYLIPHRIQVFGKTEISYLRSLDLEQQRESMRRFFDAADVACCIVARGMEVPPMMVEACENAGVPLLLTELLTPDAIAILTRVLTAHFATRDSLHGVLLDVFGVGILLMGDSGVGKSECGLDLILKGHRLVADDLVEVSLLPPASIYGQSPEITRYHMEVRGLGVLNIKELFGVSAVRDRKKIQLVITFVEWDESVEYDRIGLEQDQIRIMETELPHIVLPVRPGRNLTAIVEVAARDFLLKLEGYHAAREFQSRLLDQIADPHNNAPLDEEPE